MNYILFTGLLQIVMAIAFISFGKKKEKADYLLLILLGCIGIHLAAKFYIFTTVANTAVIFRMHTCIQLAYGPLLYLYTRKTGSENFMPASMWYLFVPLIVMITLYTCTSLAIFRYPVEGAYILQIYNTVAFFPIIASHIIFGIITPKGSTKNKNTSIGGLRYILIALGITEIALFTAGNMNTELNSYIRCVIYVLLGSIPVLLLWSRLEEGMPQLSSETSTKKQAQETEERKPALDSTKHEALFGRLEAILQEKELYKDENLSLEKLSEVSGLSRHHISETLNIYAQKTFYQYINEYRIKEVLHKIDTSGKKNIRLLPLAYDCGFKTKASFNQYFKKLTGTTPSGYIKEKAA